MDSKHTEECAGEHGPDKEEIKREIGEALRKARRKHEMEGCGVVVANLLLLILGMGALLDGGRGWVCVLAGFALFTAVANLVLRPIVRK